REPGREGAGEKRDQEVHREADQDLRESEDDALQEHGAAFRRHELREDREVEEGDLRSQRSTPQDGSRGEPKARPWWISMRATPSRRRGMPSRSTPEPVDHSVMRTRRPAATSRAKPGDHCPTSNVIDGAPYASSSARRTRS